MYHSYEVVVIQNINNNSYKSTQKHHHARTLEVAKYISSFRDNVCMVVVPSAWAACPILMLLPTSFVSNAGGGIVPSMQLLQVNLRNSLEDVTFFN